MPNSTTDKAFVAAFCKEFIAYLSKTVDPQHPFEHDVGHVDKTLKGVDTYGIGYVSRIFDGIKSLPILTQSEFTSLASEHGGVDVLMQNILDEVSTFMLNADKSGLHDDVIKALGTDVYQNLLNQPDATPKNIAKYFLAAVLSLYKQTLQANAAFAAKNFLYQSSITILEKASQQLNQVIAKNELKVSSSSPNQKSDLVLGSPEQMETAVHHLLIEVENIVSKDNVDPAQIEKAYHDFNNIRCVIQDYFNQLTSTFNKDIGVPMQEAYEQCVATGFAISSGAKKVSNVAELSVDEQIELINTKVNALSGMLDRMRADEALTPKELEILKANTSEYFECAEKVVALYQSYKDGEIMSSAEDTATRMQDSFNRGVRDLVSKIEPNAFQVQPSKPLMNVFFRILRALFIWRMVSESEQADIERAMNESVMVKELHAPLTNKSFLIEDKIEEITDIVTHSRTTSGSDEELKFCSSPISLVGDNRELNQSPTGVADYIDYSEDTFKKIYGVKHTQGFFCAAEDPAMKKVADVEISPEEKDAKNYWVQS